MSEMLFYTVFASFAELHLFYAALAPGKNFDAAPDLAALALAALAPAPAPTLLYTKSTF
jgi:hypothetical protein